MTLLRTVLELSASLDSVHSSAKQTLRQLVPVHESLLRAVVASDSSVAPLASTTTNEGEAYLLRVEDLTSGGGGGGGATGNITSSLSFACDYPSKALTPLESGDDDDDDGRLWAAAEESIAIVSPRTADNSKWNHHGGSSPASSASAPKLVSELNKLKALSSSSTDDLVLCGQIMLDPLSPLPRKLFVLQRLMFPIADSLERLVFVLLPLVPWTLKTAVSRKEITDEESMHRPLMEESVNLIDFLEACLDAAFSSSTTPSSWNADGLDACLEQLVQVTTIQSREYWIFACRILVRLFLHHHCGEDEQDHGVTKAKVTRAVVRYILVGLDAAGSHQVPVEWILPSLNNDLLPLLKGNPDHMAPLWVHVWTQLSPPADAPQDELAHRWMLQTAVLCAILPDMVRSSNARLFIGPAVERFSEADSVANDQIGKADALDDGSLPSPARGHPIQSPVLWNLIHTCLMQGLYVSKKQSWIQESWTSEDATNCSGGTHGISFGTCQLLRRRGLFLLATVVDGSIGRIDDRVANKWKKYVVCSETIEMERTPHLIDQVWGTIAEIGSELEDDSLPVSSPAYPPPLSWRWMYPLLARAITSNEAPSLRKLCLYRLFQGQAGILLLKPLSDVAISGSLASLTAKKSRTGNRPSKVVSGMTGAPMDVVTPDFVLNIVIPAFDTLESASGSQMHVEEDRKELRFDMYHLLGAFLDAYLATVNESKCEALFRGLWSKRVLGQLNRKTTVSIYSSVSSSLRRRSGFRIPTNAGMYTVLLESLKDYFSLGSLIPAQHESILDSLAVMLSRCHGATVDPLPQQSMLGILALFPVAPREKSLDLIDEAPADRSLEDFQTLLEYDTVFSNLRQWICNICVVYHSGSTPAMGAAIATAFVDGSLLPSIANPAWEPSVGAYATEKEIGSAVVLFCALVCTLGNEAAESTTVGSLLWPAIHKGLTSNVPIALALKTKWIKADVISRAIILMENGCKLHVISGLGNGDLVVDRKTQDILPPPQKVEHLVGFAVAFLIHHLRQLFGPSSEGPVLEPRVLLATFTGIVSQLETLRKGYPSSVSIQREANVLLNEALTLMASPESGTETEPLECIATVCASLACGGVFSGKDLLKNCRELIHMKYQVFVQSTSASCDDQAYRSVFEYAKWSALSKILPRAFDAMTRVEIDTFVDELVDEAIESVPSAPQQGLLPIFHCFLVATKFGLEPSHNRLQSASDEQAFRIDKVVRSFVRILSDCKGSGNMAHMIDDAAALLFQPELLVDEAERYLSDPESNTPLLNAFRGFIQLAGSKRHHILEAVLCRATIGWLGPSSRREVAGIAAIPYIHDILSLLLYKEEKMDDVQMGQTDWRSDRSGEFLKLPYGTHESSVARGFILLFLSRLPDVHSGLPPTVLSNFATPLIYRLLDEVKPRKGVPVSLCSGDYIRKIRGWQALCVLSRFVVSTSALYVSAKVFECMEEILHGQIRYFIEVFTIRCSRYHPVIFGNALVKQITRTDLSLQQVSSLMIVAGNLVVGRYRDDFFLRFNAQEWEGGLTSLGLLLSGLIPWLGSTQGFSRAIAQLLVHRLIPTVVEISTPSNGDRPGDNNWYLRSIYNFLEQNSEMKRLRMKQVAFFEQYDVDYVCTPEGILSLAVDEGGEALPVHAVEIMKESLRQVFQEANSENTPTWKHLEAIAQVKDTTASHALSSGDSATNFQRKIIPIDALNLALEDIQETRQRNRAGRKKQKLIVCATFIDKVPNLGGLARTAEIFAAEKLVIPDLRIAKTDSFRGLSVSAGDWIEIEECREEVCVYGVKRNAWLSLACQ
jgi:hypothetical protein